MSAMVFYLLLVWFTPVEFHWGWFILSMILSD
jgi:hypothetical protein